MWAIQSTADGGLVRAPRERPTPGPGEVAIQVAAAGVNRADLLQRRGLYPPPPGASPILGLECAGTLTEVGADVAHWRVGDRVCALLTGGAYAETVVCPAGQLLPVPAGLELVEAAALPEVWATVTMALHVEARLQPSERVLLHAGASGVGTAALQYCAALGCPSFVIVGSEEKIERCRALGADGGFVRHDGPWLDAVRAWAPGGVDVIIDPVGGPTVPDDQRALATDGRIVVLGLLGGRTAEVDLGRLLVKRQRLIGTVLRARSAAAKATLIDAVRDEIWPRLGGGAPRPVIHRVFPIDRADEAHALLASNQTVGKLVLAVDADEASATVEAGAPPGG